MTTPVHPEIEHPHLADAGPLQPAVADWPATRSEGLRRLDQFAAVAGHAYAAKRNYDYSPSERANVSVLSPYLRHRLITESEVVNAVLARHSAAAAEKFIDEVCWRTYWKGWLQHRPGVWMEYQSDVATLSGLRGLGSFQAKRYHQAMSSDTGIACFDAWVRELCQTGYLHNHARMWFASIWVFTLELPWQLGADFFYRRLLDGDPASNTLSWRWVAGRHTLGKTYLARADNIARYTNGRFPATDGLAGVAPNVSAAAHPPLRHLQPGAELPAAGTFAILVTEDDLAAESWQLDGREIDRVFALDPASGRPELISEGAIDFKRRAVRDGWARAAAHYKAEARIEPASAAVIVEAALAASITHLVTSDAAVGPGCVMLDELSALAHTHGIVVVRLRRAWDDQLWPHASKSFFNLKSRIPSLLARVGVGSGQRDLFAPMV